MKVNEIRNLSDKEINEKIVSCKEELFNLRLQQAKKKKKKPSRIRELTTEELLNKVEELKAELYNLRFANATGNLEKPSKIKEDRKTIARIKQVLTERENENK